METLASKTKQGQESNMLCDVAPTKSGKIKRLKFSENVNFVETNSVDSILEKMKKHDKTTRQQQI